jgi:hypothetical protein
MSKKNEMIKEVYDDPVMKSLMTDMTEEDKLKIDAALKEFVDLFAGPLVDTFEQIANDPEAVEELKRQLRKSPKDVVKKSK